MQQPNPFNTPQYSPGYYAPPPPPPQQIGGGPMVINLSNNNKKNDGSFCPTCNRNTPAFPKRTIGFAAIAWCICLSLFFGIFGLVALCTQGFMDTELVCPACQTVKQTIPANLC